MNSASKVRELDFSDLYLGHPSLEDRFSDVPGAPANPLCAGPALSEDLARLGALCRLRRQAMPAAHAFTLSHDEVSYRVALLHSAAGITFVLRKMAASVEPLAALGMPQAYLRQLMAGGLSGLLIVCGAAKSGKTMTACAIVKDRLHAFGGVAVTGESPIELPLEGNHGQGVCFQTVLPGGRGQFAGAFRQLLRAGPQIILVDEIADQETAAELLQASVNGHLIVTTVQAESVSQALGKLYALAAHRLPEHSTRTLMADGLAGVLYQQLQRGPKPMLRTELLWLKGMPAAQALLRSGDYDMLGSDLKRQMAGMITANAAAQRRAEA